MQEVGGGGVGGYGVTLDPNWTLLEGRTPDAEVGEDPRECVSAREVEGRREMDVAGLPLQGWDRWERTGSGRRDGG